MKKLIKLLLLFVMSFSIAHGVVLDTHHKHHVDACSIEEYIQEFSSPHTHEDSNHKGDICDSHYIFHISFLLPSLNHLNDVSFVEIDSFFKSKLNSFLYISNTFRPPIA